MTTSYPCGQDVSGVVVKVGEGVTNVQQDDDVVGKSKNRRHDKIKRNKKHL